MDRPRARGRSIGVSESYLFCPGARDEGLPDVVRQLDAPDVPACGPGLPPSA